MVGRLDELRHELGSSYDGRRRTSSGDRVVIVRRATIALLTTVLALAFCACDPPARARETDAAMTSPSIVVDSILPSGEALRRFQSRLTRVTELDFAAPTRDDLVVRFFDALESADTAGLRALLVSKAEYAYLYFPTSVYSRKPYELPPDIAWLLSEQNNVKGLTRMTRRLGGTSLDYRGYDCAVNVTESENRFWRSCDVSYTDPTTGEMVKKRLFGAIMERDGQYKFLSYANDF